MPATPATPTPAAPRAPRPANPTIHVDQPVTRYADDRRQPRPEPPPPQARPEPKPASPAIDTGPPTQSVPLGGHPTTRRRPAPDVAPDAVPVRDARPVPDAAPAPEVERPPTRVPLGSHPTTRRKPEPRPANPTIHVSPPPIGNPATPPPYATPERDPVTGDAPSVMTPTPGDSPGERPGETQADRVKHVEEDGGGGFDFGVPDIDMPDLHVPDVELPDVSTPDIDTEWFTNTREKFTDTSSEGILAGAENTREWLDEKPICAGGTVYRYGGGGGEVCIDTRTGRTSVKGQLGVGIGATVKIHRPDSLPESWYCGGGVTAASPVMYGTYERRYDFEEGEWYNEYEYGVSVPYKNKKYLPLDGGSRRPVSGKHVAPRGERLPASTSTPRHRAAPSPVKTVGSYAKPGTGAAYGACGGPGPRLW